MIKYSNRVATLDIESTTFYDKKEKCMKAFVYSIAMNIDGKTHVWRTVKEWLDFLDSIEINDEPLIIYVHNLGYEFSFLHKYLSERYHINNLCCANSIHKPIRFRLFEDLGRGMLMGKLIEFRCSFMLSGMSLAKTCEGQTHTKMVGDLDYSLIRHSKTPLTEKDLGYIKGDVECLAEWVGNMFKKHGVNNLPLTATGFVRNKCRKACFKEKGYHNFINKLVMSKDVAKLMIEGFSGGYTHANRKYANKIVKNVKSYDITSDYPARMLLNYYPMSSFVETAPNLFNDLSKTHCCIGVFRFKSIAANDCGSPAISLSKCRRTKQYEDDNGRILYAEEIELVCTEVDIESYKLMYTWEEMEVVKLYTADRGYLPDVLLKLMYEFYLAKTTLKGVVGKEDEYMFMKSLLNSIYGMMVTGLLRPEFSYNNDESTVEMSNCLTFEELLQKAQDDKKRFLYYPWGVYITAHARHELFRMISKTNGTYVYSDTDSIKVVYTKEFDEEIKKRNEELTTLVEKRCKELGIDPRPKTVKGEEKMISLWDDDGTYTYFKTLGSKRYMCYDKKADTKHKWSLTCSGVDKKKGMEWFRMKGKTIIGTFNEFRDGIVISKEYSGKTVVRRSMSGEKEYHEITDYTGITDTVEVWTYSTISESDYNLQLGERYRKLLKKYEGVGLNECVKTNSGTTR